MRRESALEKRERESSSHWEARPTATTSRPGFSAASRASNGRTDPICHIVEGVPTATHRCDGVCDAVGWHAILPRPQGEGGGEPSYEIATTGHGLLTS
ncbi:hypothetical protein IF2G_06356 [Cordyceps javanica]|nr:hypothetical protein IF2G_06356 [Cordyceps javanica]